MTITTKYDIGQEVWFWRGDTLDSGAISNITLSRYRGDIYWRYIVKEGFGYGMDESELYPTQASAIESQEKRK